MHPISRSLPAGNPKSSDRHWGITASVTPPRGAFEQLGGRATAARPRRHPLGPRVLQTELPDRRTVVGRRTLPGIFTTVELHIGRTYTSTSMARIRSIPPGGNRFDIPPKLLPPCWQKHTRGSADVMGRLCPDMPAVTIRTEFFKPEKGRYLHPTEDRALTHYEAALIQGFPATHRWVGSKTAIARQIGNAVPIPLGKAIANHLANAIGLSGCSGTVGGPSTSNPPPV